MSEIPIAVQIFVRLRDGYTCMLCHDEPIMPNVEVPHPLAFTFDHIVPQSLGGTHDPTNLRGAHFICNSVRQENDWTEEIAYAATTKRREFAITPESFNY